MNESGTSIQQRNNVFRVISNDDDTSLQETTCINTSTYGEGFGSPRKRGEGACPYFYFIGRRFKSLRLRFVSAYSIHIV